jgi:protein-disulfide isomerase
MSSRRAPVQHPQKRAEAHSSRGLLYAVVLVGAGTVAALLMLVSEVRHRDKAPSTPSDTAAAVVAGAGETTALFAGIPQHGNALGSPKAPVTLVEYADLQCPFCAEFSRTGLPALVDRYVRPGKVRIVFRGLAFVGPDSTRALQVALAAAAQDKLWNVTHLLYENQGTENTGWVTDELLRSVAGSVKGLDAGRVLAERSSSDVAAQITALHASGTRASVTGTPTFFAGRTGGALTRMQLESLGGDAFAPTLDALLAT